MKKTFFIFTFLLFAPIIAFAQKTIIDDINSNKRGQGQVVVMQDESINKLLGTFHTTTQSATESASSSDSDYIKVRGWRIQVFSGNQQSSKGEAEYRKSKVHKAFPDLEAFLEYIAPTWRLRVGNFTNEELAEETLAEMKEILPSLAREMYLVQEIIKVPKN